jgi:predicted DNA-binding transcriptional regulator AlpA
MGVSNSDPQAAATSSAGSSSADKINDALHELLTVEDVAALLKVSKTWVYEHTRTRGAGRSERLPCLKIGKYTRFDPQSVREFLRRRSKTA